MSFMHQQLLIEQCLFETESWVRLVSFMFEENTIYKKRLAETVKEMGRNDNALLMAEHFHEDFLAQDATLGYLKKELQKQKQLLQQGTIIEKDVLRELVSYQKRLRNDIRDCEDHFSRVKTNFSEYLSANFEYYKAS